MAPTALHAKQTSADRFFQEKITGRWMSCDPSTEDGMNLYVYVKNNPICYNDPDGRNSQTDFERENNNVNLLDTSYLDSIFSKPPEKNSLGLKIDYGIESEESLTFDSEGSVMTESEYKRQSIMNDFSVLESPWAAIAFGAIYTITDDYAFSMQISRYANFAESLVACFFMIERNPVAVEPNSGVTSKGNYKPGNSSFGKKASRNANMKPDLNAIGDHTVFKGKPGDIKSYETYKVNLNNPSGFQSVKRVDIKGKPNQFHINKVTKEKIPLPHVHEKSTPGGVRPANINELTNYKKKENI